MVYVALAELHISMLSSFLLLQGFGVLSKHSVESLWKTYCYIVPFFPSSYHCILALGSYKVTSYNCLTTGKSSRYLWGLHVSASSFSFLSRLAAFTTFSDITDKLGATQISDLNAIYLFLKVTWFIGLVFTLSGTVFHLLVTSVS